MPSWTWTIGRKVQSRRLRIVALSDALICFRHSSAAPTTRQHGQDAPLTEPAQAVVARPTSLPRVLISHASSDGPRAAQLGERLEAAAVPVWLDRRSIAGGASWDVEIVRGIKACAAVAVLVSPEAVGSRNVQQELRLALQYDKPLLPLLLELTEYPEEVEYALAGRQRIELLDHPEAEWLPRVLQALGRLR
jgi:TIR domain